MFTRFARTAVVVRAAVVGLPIVVWTPAPALAQRSQVSSAADLTLNVDDVRDGELAAAITRAARGARRRLASEDCLRMLVDFSDANGRSLSDVLSSLALSPVASLSRIIFRDGREATTCRSMPVAAFTGAGSRVVFVCGNRFAKLGRDEAERVVLHELLHTLGLGERPPTPAQIDRQVDRRCRS